MEIKKFKVTEECISCGACIEIAEKNFDFGQNSLAYVKKQPENQEELKQTLEAMEACPVGAIIQINEQQQDIKPIVAKDNVKQIIDKYPELKNILAELSPKFKRLQNPTMYNTLARFINFQDAARITGISICEILHTVNKFIGTEEKLHQIMPDCIKQTKEENKKLQSEPITWTEPQERFLYTPETITLIIEKIKNLKPHQSLVIFSTQNPIEIIKLAKGLNFKVNIEKNRDYRISIFNPQKPKQQIEYSNFDILDLRNIDTEPFDIIMKKANSIEEGNGFIIIQKFIPTPIINMLTELDFNHKVETKKQNEIWVYFYKKNKNDKIIYVEKQDKIPVVIQSATPVAYPVIMRLLQSNELSKIFKIKELKIWSETEKHLSWITNGKADISFTALLTTLRTYRFGIKVPAIFVWDNFVLLSRKKIKSFADIKGQEIHLPLFNEAPPAKITRYLMTATGHNPNDYKFVYGKPFGRPEQIYKDFILGKANTVVLREPEASYAIKILKDRKENYSELSYNELWNKVNPGFGSFPNAGVAIKETFIKQHPEATKKFLKLLQQAIEWTNNNKDNAAKLSADIMRQPVDRIRLFLDRVHFEYLHGEPLINKVKQYFEILYRNQIINDKIQKDFYDTFII